MARLLKVPGGYCSHKQTVEVRLPGRARIAGGGERGEH